MPDRMPVIVRAFHSLDHRRVGDDGEMARMARMAKLPAIAVTLLERHRREGARAGAGADAGAVAGVGAGTGAVGGAGTVVTHLNLCSPSPIRSH